MRHAKTYPLGGSLRRYCMTTHPDRAWTSKGGSVTPFAGPALFHGQLSTNSKKSQELVQINLIDTGQHFGRPARSG